LSPSFANRPLGFTMRCWKSANDELSILWGGASGDKSNIGRYPANETLRHSMQHEVAYIAQADR
jgi:hypothetical protein